MGFLISKKCFGGISAAIFVLAFFQMANIAESSSLNLPEGGAMFARDETDLPSANLWSLTDLVYGVRNFWKANADAADDSSEIGERNDASEESCYVGAVDCGLGRIDLSLEKIEGNNNKGPSKDTPLHLRLKPKHREIPTYNEDEF